MVSMWHRDGFTVTAYGATEIEALANLKIALAELGEIFTTPVDFENVQYVDGHGNPTTKNW